jgi:thioredoxin-related protein
MKTTILAISAFVAALTFNPSAVQAQQDSKMNPGDALPAYAQPLKDATSDGNTVHLNQLNGKNGLLVMFSCNTCPFVVKNQPVTDQTLKFASEHGLGVVIINSNEAQRTDADSYEAMHKYARAQKYNVPYVMDENSTLADMFGANHTPEIFLFNSQNKLVYKGAMNDNPGNPKEAKVIYVQDAINAMIAGREPNPKVTKSVGCSIKRKA